MRCTLAAVWCIPFVPTSAEACRTDHPLVLSGITQAEAVFVGRVTLYQYLDEAPAVITIETIETIETLHGRSRPAWIVKWHNSTFALPDEWDRPEPLIFAVINSVPPKNSGINYPLIPEVQQAPCAPPFIFEDSPEMRREIAALLQAPAQ